MGVGIYQEGRKNLFTQGLFEESKTQKERLGTKRELDDGRVFRYTKFSAAVLAAGCLVSKVQTPVDGTVAAADAALAITGAQRVSVTAAGITAALLQDGELVVKAGTNIGSKYKIRGCGATGGIGTGRVAIELYDKIRETWVAASTTVALHQNPYKDLLINPAVANSEATTQETVMGCTTMIHTASYYAWIQTRGLACLVLDVDSPAGAEANEMLITQGTTAGRGLVIHDTSIPGMQVIGHTLESADLTDAEGSLVFLTIE